MTKQSTQEQRVLDLLIDLRKRIARREQILSAEISGKHRVSAAIFPVLIHAGVIQRNWRWVIYDGDRSQKPIASGSCPTRHRALKRASKALNALNHGTDNKTVD